MIKSQDELNTCNDGKRKSAVLISAIEHCEKLEKQLEIAVKALETIKTAAWFGKNTKINIDTPDSLRLKSVVNLAEQALKEIEK